MDLEKLKETVMLLRGYLHKGTPGKWRAKKSADAFGSATMGQDIMVREYEYSKVVNEHEVAHCANATGRNGSLIAAMHNALPLLLDAADAYIALMVPRRPEGAPEAIVTQCEVEYEHG